MPYNIRHFTRYRYSAPIRESIMEARMQPRSDGNQHCSEFRLDVTPRARPTCYHDHLGNVVHHFDIPGEHQELFLLAESVVEVEPLPPLPAALPHRAWIEVDALASDGLFWDLLQASAFVQSTQLLEDLAAALSADRRHDPLTAVLQINQGLYQAFSYVPQSTRVDSTIDDAIAHRRGVCQDFSHIMLALLRRLGIPARYVSGYLYHRKENHDRSEDDASHAWVEAYLPGLGWRGFDPTNNLVVGERHIRVAVGRDYADVPPTRGVFKGLAASELGVSVRVSPIPLPITAEEQVLLNTVRAPAPRPSRRLDAQAQQQQQQ
jgi:transglutaminase-like putative cysteine protease